MNRNFSFRAGRESTIVWYCDKTLMDLSSAGSLRLEDIERGK